MLALGTSFRDLASRGKHWRPITKDELADERNSPARFEESHMNGGPKIGSFIGGLKLIVIS